MAEIESIDKLEQYAFTDKDVDMAEVEVQLAEVIKLLQVDGESFIEFYLGSQLDMQVPQFHIEVWSKLTDLEKARVLLAIPRDHAKTTLAKLTVVWYFLFTPARFCVYLSNTNAIAKAACKDIFAFFQIPNHEHVFGKITIHKESEHESLWIFSITSASSLVKADGIRKRCILRGIGQGQQMRGINIDNQRPDIAVIDDVEDNENTDSIGLQKKLDKWIFGPFIKALARQHKIIWLGNMLAKTSLLARLSRRANWNPVVFGALIKDRLTGKLKPLWPDKWTIKSLIADFLEYRSLGLIESWMCEMMNMPGHSENGFTIDMINYAAAPVPDECQVAWITIDPAFGIKAVNDESSIAVHALTEDGVPVTVQIAHGRWNETELFNQALSLSRYWNAKVWGIEAVAAQRVLIPLFSLLATGQRLNSQLEFVPIHVGSQDSKSNRISALVGLMKDGLWAIADNDVDFTTQLLEYNLGSKNNADDIVDSVAHGPFMHDTYLGLIQAYANGQTPDSSHQVQAESDIY